MPDTEHAGDQSAAEVEQEYERIDEFRHDDLVLEIGLSGLCKRCEEQLVRAEIEGSLKCPDCGYIVGLVIHYPSLKEGGEPGRSVDWPKKRHGWEVDGGRAILNYGIRGRHDSCGDLVINEKQSHQFGLVPDAACDGCGGQFGAAYKANTHVDPINDIDNLGDR